MPTARHETLGEVGRVVVAVGTCLLGAGASSDRVERGLQRTAVALGCSRVSALVTLQTLVVTVERDGATWTESAQAPALHVDADRLDRLERLVRQLPAGVTPGDLTARLQSVLARPPLYPAWLVALAVGVACAGFAGLNGGGAVELTAAFLGASLGQVARAAALRRAVNPFLVVAGAAALSAAVYLGVVALLRQAQIADTSNEAGFVSAVLYLVPGFALVTGVLDLLRAKVESGLARLTYASTVLVMAALGLLAVTALTDPHGAASTGSVAEERGWVAVVVLTVLSAVGFAVLFRVPRRLLLLTGAAAVVGNVARLGLVEAGTREATASFVGGLLVGLIVAAAARGLRFSRIVVAVPAVIPMVPGTAAYTGIIQLSEGTLLPALGSGLAAGLAVGGLALGLALARVLTDRDWAFTSPP